MQVRPDRPQAAVVGAGPNGLAAAITVANAGYSVTVYEANETPGGGVRSAELTLPGFVHDLCSAVYPLGVASPVFRPLPLGRHGLEWVHPPAPLAHPFDDGTAVLVERSIDATSRRLGADGAAYRRLMEPFVRHWDALASMILQPLLRFSRHPLLLARFGLRALLPARRLSALVFREQPSRALFAGLAAHSMLSLDQPISASFGLVLGALAHRAGWPLVRGGAQNLTSALAGCLRESGGKIVTGMRVESLAALRDYQLALFDVTPRQFLRIANDRLPRRFCSRLRRYRYGPGAFKLDYALDAPVPWKARDCFQAATVHCGGTSDDIAVSERAVACGQIPEHPFVLVVQPSLFDSSRAPEGKHTLWAYCHVPNGSTADMTARVEAQIERFAPGFRDRILARSAMQPAALERHNANYVGGDINGGIQDIRQLIARPSRRLDPYSTPLRGVYLCSSSTPPGGGVHGMCGYNAASSALKHR